MEKYIQSKDSPTGFVKQIDVDPQVVINQLSFQLKFANDELDRATKRRDDLQSQIDSLTLQVPDLKVTSTIAEAVPLQEIKK